MKRAVPIVALMAVVAAGAALRLARLDNRPMHCDEAVHAIKFGRLLEHNDYIYDPREYHGPTLNFLTLPVAWITTVTQRTDITEVHLRLVPAFFGAALVGLVWLLRSELGVPATLLAALLTAISPSMVFYSRYYIQEMLLVFFTFGAMVSLWRFVRQQTAAETERPRTHGPLRLREAIWPVLFGLCIGMMHASKETCVISLFAMVVAAAFTMTGLRTCFRNQITLPLAGGSDAVAAGEGRKSWPSPALRGRPSRREGGDGTWPNDHPAISKHVLRRLSTKHLAWSGLIAVVTAAIFSALFYSSFFQNPGGVRDSYATFMYYLGRASGEGSAGQHVYPWHYYLRILFWWPSGSGMVWSEASVATLALVGLGAAILGRGISPSSLPLARFVSIYTITLILVYSALPYKTPWCALGFLHGVLLLAGVGAAMLIHVAPGYALKSLTITLLVAALGHLGWQAWQASFVSYEDPHNPYVYAHTTSDVHALVRRVKQIAASHPDGLDVHIQVVCPDHDYWPLPWYLRQFPRVGFFGRVPQGPPAAILVTQPEMEPMLLEYLYLQQPPGQRYLYVPVAPPPANRDWQLRPHVPLRVYVRLDLWELFQADQTR